MFKEMCFRKSLIYFIIIKEFNFITFNRNLTSIIIRIVRYFYDFFNEITIQNKTIYIAKESIKSVLNGNPQEFDVAYINEIMDYIPDNEKDSIYLYGFGSCSQWYAKAGIFPPNR